MTNKTSICVDLDGTLIYQDISLILFYVLMYDESWSIPGLIFMMFAGSELKVQEIISYRTVWKASRLSYNKEFLNWVSDKAESGHKIYLATGSNEELAKVVFKYINIFEQYYASDIRVKLTSHNKAKKLNQVFGRRQYIYCGNEKADYPVWKDSQSIVVVNSSKKVLNNAKRLGLIKKHFLDTNKGFFSKIFKLCLSKYYLFLAAYIIPMEFNNINYLCSLCLLSYSSNILHKVFLYVRSIGRSAQKIGLDLPPKSWDSSKINTKILKLYEPINYLREIFSGHGFVHISTASNMMILGCVCSAISWFCYTNNPSPWIVLFIVYLAMAYQEPVKYGFLMATSNAIFSIIINYLQ